MINKLFSTLAVAFALATTSCEAQGFHLAQNPQNVLYVATTGNDLTAHRANTNWPYATIKAAIQSAQPGDKIIVGAGTFTGNAASLTLPSSCKLIGAGTNSTICDINVLKLSESNEVAGIAFTNRAGLIGLGQIQMINGGASHLYLHDLIVKSSSECLTIGSDAASYNVISNCVFDTKEWGVECVGTNYFFNCAIVKNADAGLAFGARLLGGFENGGIYSYIFWSGGSITSTTNSNAGLNDPTNNWAVWNGNGAGSTITLQNTTISTPAGGKEIYGIAGNTNFIAGVTWTASKTNGAAVIVSNAPPLFSNVAQTSGKWQGKWRAGTPAAPPRLTIPTSH